MTWLLILESAGLVAAGAVIERAATWRATGRLLARAWRDGYEQGCDDEAASIPASRESDPGWSRGDRVPRAEGSPPINTVSATPDAGGAAAGMATPGAAEDFWGGDDDAATAAWVAALDHDVPPPHAATPASPAAGALRPDFALLVDAAFELDDVAFARMIGSWKAGQPA